MFQPRFEFFCLRACAASTLPSNPRWLLSVQMWTRASLMRKTLAAPVLIVQNIVAFIVGWHCATSVQCLKRTRTLPVGRQERALPTVMLARTMLAGKENPKENHCQIQSLKGKLMSCCFVRCSAFWLAFILVRWGGSEIREGMEGGFEWLVCEKFLCCLDRVWFFNLLSTW